MRLLSLRHQSRGDTIIEVLIAIAIVSLTLGSAYAVTNRTLRNARQAQEHTEALKLLEGQLEQLKAAAKVSGSTVFSGAAIFCMDSNGTMVPIGGSSLPASSYPAACSVGTVPGGYHLGIERGSNNVFTAQANWDGPTGSVENVSLIYRLYP